MKKIFLICVLLVTAGVAIAEWSAIRPINRSWTTSVAYTNTSVSIVRPAGFALTFAASVTDTVYVHHVSGAYTNFVTSYALAAATNLYLNAEELSGIHLDKDAVLSFGTITNTAKKSTLFLEASR